MEKLARIRAKMVVYANQNLTDYERRMRIEWDAR